MKPFPLWFARIAVAAVFLMNVSCAIDFILRPERYAGGFEVGGVVGNALVQSLGILFLMWNATYPPVIWQPVKHKTLFIVILIQQLIGVIGESWLYFQMPAEHAALRATGLRFMLFDGLGLVLLSIAFGWLVLKRKTPTQVTQA